MTNTTGRDEALDWLAGRVQWERLLDELRDLTVASAAARTASHRDALARQGRDEQAA